MLLNRLLVKLIGHNKNMLRKIINEDPFRWDKVANDALEGIKMAVAWDFKIIQ